MASFILFDQVSRKIIIDFYSRSKGKSKLWIWWNKNIIVTNYESIKAKKEMDIQLKKLFKSLLHWQ